MTCSAAHRLESMTAIIADMDGVVTDTASVHAAAWKRLFDEYLAERAARLGQPFTPFDLDVDYARYVDGRPRYEGVATFLASRGIELPRGDPAEPPERETVQGLGNRKNRYFAAHLEEHGAGAYPSTVEFLSEARSRGMRTAVVSSSRNCAQVVESAGVAALFDARVDGTDLERLALPGKPDPAMFVEAARRLGVEPASGVVIEDALAGVEAGRRGGFGLVVGVDRSGHGDELRERGADVVVHDLGEIVWSRREHAPESSPIDRLPGAIPRAGEVARRLREGTPVVFLDYDGTLTPIVGHPADATLGPETRELVRRLAKRHTVGILSGMDRADVRERVGVEGLVYAGSHGFDVESTDGRALGEERWGAFLAPLDRAEERLRRSLGETPGCFVERKRFAVAVHFRMADEAASGDIERRVREVAGQETDLWQTGGKKIFELRPAVEWDKGKALLWTLESLGLTERHAVPLFIGDDLTDEDAFRAIRDTGIGVVVGEGPRRTAARYALRDPAEVREFLARLLPLVDDTR